MINAKEARELAEKNNKEYELALGKVENLITEQAEVGWTHAEVMLPDMICVKVQETLKAHDYKVVSSVVAGGKNMRKLVINW